MQFSEKIIMTIINKYSNLSMTVVVAVVIVLVTGTNIVFIHFIVIIVGLLNAILLIWFGNHVVPIHKFI
jgi:hypothetical protein